VFRWCGWTTLIGKFIRVVSSWARRLAQRGGDCWIETRAAETAVE
jgi:hypothetical protein